MMASRQGTAFEDRRTTGADGYEACPEVFAPAKHGFKTEAEIANEGKTEKKKGRLGRLTYEFRMADAVNQNRRLYPSSVVKAAVASFVERVNRNVVYGRLDHPSEWDSESLVVTTRDASHLVSEATMVDDTDIRVSVDIMDNEHGRQLLSVLEVGGNPGISQRAQALWREISSAERVTFKVPETDYVRVADAMRLITYDIVSEPGFGDADEPTVSESKEAIGVDSMTLEQLRAQHPQLVLQLLNEGKAAAMAELPAQITAAVEKKKPEILAEAATAAANEKKALTEQIDKIKASFETLKPVMKALGVVNEQLTDVAAAAKVATMEGQIADLTRQVKEAEEKVKAATAATLAHEQASAQLGYVKLVATQYAAHEHARTIVTQVHGGGPYKDAAEALARAKSVADLIAAVAPNTSGQKKTEQTSFTSLEAILATLPAKPGDGSGGSGGGAGGNASEGAIAGMFARGGAGLPSI